ncbi:hypothetical protein [Mariprofundus ferrooxydans]|uniref:hypothetical protein n=1 Tax=Mariprofundus ferrooxydans TaxID=314344 RepID=UPI0006A6ADCD|nr:hypothetical protein [Mariprofundus ferrooxydans]KON48568.1 hypothetical protein AL013_02800 [Mariprofundus ferrooxydans]
MAFVTYKIQKQLRTVGRGATEAKHGRLESIVKQDNAESPAQVYCEYVACRLAAMVGVPVATGVLVAHDTGLKYASLMLSEIAVRMEDVNDNKLDKLLSRYPVECAKIAVFDIWIGNPDRLGNVRANLGRSSDHIIVGIDHGGGLLSCATNQYYAIDRLRDKSWPENHAFGSQLSKSYCDAMVSRIQRIDDEAIDDACVIGDTVGSVMLPEQAELSEILKQRRSWLSEMVAETLFST